MQHPAIVRVRLWNDVDRDGVNLAMEFLEGESLRSRLQRQHAVRSGDDLASGDRSAAGLATAHQSQVVHRDQPDTAASGTAPRETV